MRIGTAILLLLCCTFASGCSVKYKGVAAYANSDEIFYADIDHNITSGVAIVSADNKNGVTCKGTSRVTYTPPFSLGCAGQRGDIKFSCIDGRIIKAEWQAESCTSGFGMGRDDRGNKIVFAFGGDESTLASRAGAEVNKSKKPSSQSAQASRILGTGTGFFVSTDGLLVTNEHVVKGGTSFAVLTPKTKEAIQAKLIAVDPNNDLAILKIDSKTSPIPLIPRFTGRRGEDVLTLGYPIPTAQGQEQKATFGRINAVTGVRDDIRYVQVDIPIQPGNSGGPLINSQGEVIGVITSSLSGKALKTDVQNVNYALKIDYVYPMLTKTSYVQQKKMQKKLSIPELAEQYESSVVLVIKMR